MPVVVRFSHESSTAKLTVWDEERATVSNVFSVKPRRGHASGLMQEIVSYADISGLTLLLEVQQYGNARGLSNAGLKRFYGKFGFEDCGRNVMQRRPSRGIHGP